MRTMRIHCPPLGDLGEVLLTLNDDEAAELRDALDDMLTREDRSPGWHAHVPSSDFTVEITIAPEEPGPE